MNYLSSTRPQLLQIHLRQSDHCPTVPGHASPELRYQHVLCEGAALLAAARMGAVSHRVGSLTDESTAGKRERECMGVCMCECHCYG